MRVARQGRHGLIDCFGVLARGRAVAEGCRPLVEDHGRVRSTGPFLLGPADQLLCKTYRVGESPGDVDSAGAVDLLPDRDLTPCRDGCAARQDDLPATHRGDRIRDGGRWRSPERKPGL